MDIPSSERLEKVYGESTKSAERFRALAENFQKKYGHDEAEFSRRLAGRRSSATIQITTAAR